MGDRVQHVDGWMHMLKDRNEQKLILMEWVWAQKNLMLQATRNSSRHFTPTTKSNQILPYFGVREVISQQKSRDL